MTVRSLRLVCLVVSAAAPGRGVSRLAKQRIDRLAKIYRNLVFPGKNDRKILCESVYVRIALIRHALLLYVKIFLKKQVSIFCSIYLERHLYLIP